MKLSEALWVDLKSDEDRANWLLLGRGYETGIVAKAVQNELAMAYLRLAALMPQAEPKTDGECRSCFNGKCVTGRECVTLGLDDEGHRATMNLKEIQALFASVEWMTSNPKAAEKIRAELAATLYEIERVSAPQEAAEREAQLQEAREQGWRAAIEVHSRHGMAGWSSHKEAALSAPQEASKP